MLTKQLSWSCMLSSSLAWELPQSSDVSRRKNYSRMRCRGGVRFSRSCCSVAITGASSVANSHSCVVMGSLYLFQWLLVNWSIMTFWWVGGLAGASGSGNRGTTGCGVSTAVWCPGARSLWSLAVTKPKPGRHGARGTSWSYKCPLWMSSTQWGKVATVCGKGGVACGDLATGGTESSGLWAYASRDKGWSGGSHLQSSKHEHEFRGSACVPP